LTKNHSDSARNITVWEPETELSSQSSEAAHYLTPSPTQKSLVTPASDTVKPQNTVPELPSRHSADDTEVSLYTLLTPDRIASAVDKIQTLPR